VSDPATSGTPVELTVPSNTDTPEVRIGRGSALTLAAQVVGLGTSFLVSVLVARTLGPQGKGMLAVIMQVPALLLVALDLGITTANVYFVSRGETKAGTAAANSAVMAVLFGALGAPIIYLLLTGPFAVAPGIPALAVAFAIVILPTGLFASWMNGVAAGVGNLAVPLRYSIASSLTTLVGLGFLWFSGRAQVSAVVGISVLGTIVGLGALLLGLRRSLRPFAVDIGAARSAASFSAKAYLGNVAGFLLERQDVLLLGWLAGVASVGVYSVGVSFAELIWYLPNALATAIAAKGGRTSEVSGTDYVTRTTRIAVVLLAATTVVGAGVVPFAIPLIFGASFAPSVMVFFAILPGILADGVARILWSYQTVRGRQYWRQALVATGANVVAVVLLVPRWGAVGAAMASTVCYAGLAAFTVTRFCRDTGARFGDVLVPQRADIEVISRTVRQMLPGGASRS
jgi:O-antigen/teichoic acid export membrane protein